MRDERLRQRLTQEQLAVRAGVVKATVQKIESGTQVRQRTLDDVLRALRLDGSSTGDAGADGGDDPVLAAIAASRDLDPEEKAHITRQYGLLRASTWARRNGYGEGRRPRVPSDVPPDREDLFRDLVRQYVADGMTEHDAVSTARVVVTRRSDSGPDSSQLGVTGT